jgi:CBS domain containing-hemolysin-like protein
MAIILSSAIWHLPLSPTVRTNLAHTLAIPLAFCFLVYLQIIFGELCPKAVALLYPEQLARFLGPPSLVIAQIFHPFIWILNKSTHLLLGGVGIHYSGQGTYSRVTPEELQLIISTASESIGLEAEERQLLNNVFEFGEVTVADVMIPRTQLITISLQATLGELLQEVVDSGHSRYPVFGESLDDIRGIIQLKELADPLIQKLQESHGCPMTITPWIHPVRFVPEYMLLGELLPLMQRLGQSMVIVVDEYGGTAGLVTLKDVVEEIIGEGVDTQDLSEAKIRRLDSHTFIVQAQLDLEEVNKLLNVEFPLGDDYNTLGGFLIHQLQKIPAQGESLTFGPLQLTVTAAEGPRLQQIQVRRFDGLGDP